MINLNPKIWGPHAWFFIESVVIALPDTIPIEIQNELKHFFISISFLLPCETCRNHFAEYIKNTDIMNIDFSTKKKVLTWINNIHNDVRKRNKCKNITVDKTIKYYNEKYNIETKSSYLDMFFIAIFIIGLLVIIKYIFFPSKPALTNFVSNFASQPVVSNFASQPVVSNFASQPVVSNFASQPVTPTINFNSSNL